MQTNQYWAASSSEDIAGKVIQKFDDYKQFLQQSGVLSELRKSYDNFFGPTWIRDVDQSLKAIHVNHYASLIRNVWNMVTATRPAWEPVAINTDVETQSDTILAAGLLDYYMKEKGIEQKLKDATLNCLFLREGWISLDWDATDGETLGVDPETGLEIRNGDIAADTHTILDVARDLNLRKLTDSWRIVRRFKNKWDLAAKYPDLAEKIIQVKPAKDSISQYELNIISLSMRYQFGNEDLIPTYTLYHPKTPALPQGRMCEILTNDLYLFDGPLPYKRPYVFPITSGTVVDNPFGHSYMMDLLPIQDALNMAVSAIVSNQAANAVQNFQVPKGAAPNVTQVMSGMNVWEYDPKAGKLEPLDLLKTAPEVFNFAEFLINQEQLISGVSEISRGTAPATMSGTAMALLQQQALQSSSGVQQSAVLAQEAIGTGVIELLQTYAVAPRVALIAGESKRQMVKEFSNKDLKGISRVSVNVANPLTKTPAGRVEIANNLLQQGQISTPEQYISVLTTGNLEPLVERDRSQLLMVRTENEDLTNGRGAHALLTDNHPLHVLEHSVVLDSPEARQNPQITQQVLEHIQEHIDLAMQMNPAMAQMLKQQSFYQPPPPPPQAGPSASPGQVMNPQPQATQVAEETPLPKPAQPPNPNLYNEGVQ